MKILIPAVDSMESRLSGLSRFLGANGYDVQVMNPRTELKDHLASSHNIEVALVDHMPRGIEKIRQAGVRVIMLGINEPDEEARARVDKWLVQPTVDEVLVSI